MFRNSLFSLVVGGIVVLLNWSILFSLHTNFVVASELGDIRNISEISVNEQIQSPIADAQIRKYYASNVHDYHKFTKDLKLARSTIDGLLEFNDRENSADSVGVNEFTLPSRSLFNSTNVLSNGAGLDGFSFKDAEDLQLQQEKYLNFITTAIAKSSSLRTWPGTISPKGYPLLMGRLNDYMNIIKINQSPNATQICPNECGLVDVPNSVEKLGVLPVEKGEFPWVVRLKISNTTGDVIVCAGAILNSKNVLTAAQCLSSNTTHVEVLIGRVGNTAEDGEQSIQSSNWSVHPDFKQSTSISFKNDIAIIHLSKDLQIGTTATPVCLSADADYTGHAGIVAGFEFIDMNLQQNSGVLMKTGLEVAEINPCIYNYGIYGIQLSFEQICAGTTETLGCRGDNSGAPLIIRLLNRYYLIGVLSYGLSCNDNTFPGVYTSVTAHQDWIMKNIKTGYCHSDPALNAQIESDEQ